MPVLVIPPNNFTEATCNYEQPEKNELIEIDLPDLDPLKRYTGRFQGITKASIDAEESGKLIHYSNFLASKLKEVLATPGCVFLRVFSAIQDDGKHFMFIVPIDRNKKPIQTRDAIYLVPCCACPPSCDTTGGWG
jgi:hypothetical protein